MLLDDKTLYYPASCKKVGVSQQAAAESSMARHTLLGHAFSAPRRCWEWDTGSIGAAAYPPFEQQEEHKRHATNDRHKYDGIEQSAAQFLTSRVRLL